jgi:alkyl hydroperoxide reductase subunit AhpF
MPQDEPNQAECADHAGDVTHVICEQILIAIGAGARAAQSAYDYVLAQRLGLEDKSIGT